MLIRILLTFFLSIWCGLVDAGEPEVDFATQVKPLLSDRCFLCHGPDVETRQADLRLDSEDGITSPLASDSDLYAVIAGKPDQSELVARIFETDSDLVMPPPDSGLQLTQDERQMLKRWVAEGAEWKGHWAFEPIRKPEPPKVANAEWSQNPIDQFIFARQTANKLQPNQPTSRERLLRRATFDLTGLPPTLQELDAFVADDSSDAFEKQVDRLLASPHFGERMTSDWLDVARYSDTYGYQQDRDRFVWPWRDWVVKAFNDNMPYDQFITEQLAGDLIPNASRDQIVATTFNRLHPQKVEGGSVPEEFRVEYVADRAQTVATAFMGLTFECARCHDHKYDPISQKEYYQLFSFFNNIDEAGLYSYFTSSVPTPTLRLKTDAQEAQLQVLEDKLKAAGTAWTAARKAVEGQRQETYLRQLDSVKAERLADPAKLIPGRLAFFDFESGRYGPNPVIDGREGKVVELTGDSGIDVKVGNFARWQPFSVSLWLKTPKEFERSVVFHRSRAWTDAGSRGYELLIEDGKLSAALIHFWPGNAIRIQTHDRISVNEWQHVVMSYDGSSRASGLQLSLNGVPAETEVVRDNLYKNITGGGGDNIAIGQRFRDIGFAKGQVDDFAVYDRSLTALEIRHLFDGQSLSRCFQCSTSELTTTERSQLVDYTFSTIDHSGQEKRDAILAARRAVCQAQDGLQEIMVMQERPEPRTAYLLNRGAYDARGDVVKPETPVWLPRMSRFMPRNRLGLAQWLTSAEHPLTARVAVNRLWQMLFAHGLVRTPEDFGSQGMVPTHPLLLDWLAADFREHRWDVKRLLKQLMLTATYQQDSAATDTQFQADPENLWLSRAPVYRLSAEMLRDNALAVSGLLKDKIGGAPARPYELAASFKPSTPDKGDGLYRRSLYTYWKRTAPAPVMMALDASKREVCRVKREQTASPLQALVVLNGPQFVEAARSLATVLIRQHGDRDAAILVDMFRMLTSRPPTSEETAVINELLADQHQHFASNPNAVASYLAIGDSKSSSKDTVRLAAWASVANALFAFDECMMKR